MRLTLIRGIPGSGKSTLARKLVSESEDKVIHIDDDMYFTVNGEQYKFDPYKFNQSKISDAHKWCQEEVKKSLEAGVGEVIISNTFIKEHEALPYIDMAEKHNCPVFVIELTDIIGKNVHDIPPAVIVKMWDSWEPLDSWESRRRVIRQRVKDRAN